MRHPHLGVGHRAPFHLAIAATGVVCAMTRRLQPMLRCSSCTYFQGMLVGPDPCVLCAAPTSQPPRRVPRRGRPSLIFDQDWPDD
ncbi:MAG TPA: hypothetical protein VLA59_02555 [Patescibacteria group bacterium]|nr:hypothetical protein [Patescibacteria group bacterium]